MSKLEEGIWGKGRWIVLLVVINILVIFGAGVMLKEFPQRFDGEFRHVILRYDDYRVYKDNAEDMSLEEEFLKFALKKKIRISIAIIPFDLSNKGIPKIEVSPSKIEILTEGLRKNLFEICLHGYQHKNNAMGGSASEFSGVPLLSQRAWIEKGKSKLESLTGAKVKVFVPPFNGWDQNTLTALRDNGFSVLSAEAGDVPKTKGLNFFPYTVTPKELEYLLATRSFDNSKLIVVNIHPHDLLEDKNRPGLSKLEKILEEIKDPNRRMELESFEGAVGKEIAFTGEGLRYYSGMLSHMRFWENLPVSGYLMRTKSLSAKRPYYSSLILYLLKIFMAVNLFVIGFLMSQVIGKRIKLRMIILVITAFSVMAISIIIFKSFEYWYWGEVIAGKRYSVIFLTFGILIGLISKILAIRELKNIYECKARLQ